MGGTVKRLTWPRSTAGNFAIIGICILIIAIVATISAHTTRNENPVVYGGVKRSTIPPQAGAGNIQPRYTLANIQARFLTPDQVGAKYKVFDLSHIQPPAYNPHAYDNLKNPRSVLSCFGRSVTLNHAAHTARALYYRPLDGAGDAYVQSIYYVVAATYDDPTELETDYARLRNAGCASTHDTAKTFIPSNLPRDQWYFYPPTHQTWSQFTQLYKGWTDTHALLTVATPPYAGIWQQHRFFINDYLMRGNAIIAVTYSQATPGGNHQPITGISERLLSTFVQRVG
jgi:hypothetical protein